MSWTSRVETEQEARILAGGLPDLAQRRLHELRRDGMTSSFLTSAAGTLAASAALEPVGQVIGASACRMLLGVVRRTRGPRDRLRWGTPVWREHDGPVRSWSTARGRALSRLAEQARILEAHVVLGVQAQLCVQEGDPPLAEVVLTGTALRDLSGSGKRSKEPVLGLVSIAEYVLLRRAGVELVGIAGSSSSVEVAVAAATSRIIRQRFAGPDSNRELEELTTGVYEARRLAIDRLRADARRQRATGVIGVDLSRSLREHGNPRSSLGFTVLLLGTAVRGPVPHGISPTPILDVSG